MMLQAAQYYAAQLHWPVLPVHTTDPQTHGCTCRDPGCTNHGKHPALWNGVRGANADVEQIAEWWGGEFEGMNIGGATGEGMGLFVVDLDGEAGRRSMEDATAKCGRLPPTLTAQSGGGGVHYFFLLPPDAEIRNRTKILDGVDVRSTKGYILLPPSLHRSGRRYEWLDWRSAAIAPNWLLDLIASRKQAISQPTHHCEGVVLDTNDPVVQRARTYVSRIPPAVSGQGGHAQTFMVACRLTHAFGLTIEKALPVLQEFNLRCEPPWSDEELMHKLVSADACEDRQGRPRGYLLHRSRQ